MTYDDWKAREPDREDDCTGDVRTCACKGCHAYRDNWEPGDADGEAFRGEEAAAFERDQQIAAQRLK